MATFYSSWTTRQVLWALVFSLTLNVMALGIYASHRMPALHPSRQLIPWRERVTIGQYKDSTERMHVARYEFAKALCINKTVADIASGTGYGMDILRDAAKSVDGFDKENFGNNILIDLEKQAWGKSYDVIVSFETIEHLTNPEFFLENARRSSKLLVLSTPLNEHLRDSPFHKQGWTLPQVQSLLEHGFMCGYLFQDEKGIGKSAAQNTLIAVCSPKP